MPITITAKQRDALYGEVLTHLSGIGDLWLAVQGEDFATADRLGRQFADDLTLVLDDLGWGEGTEDPIELTMAPDPLRRVLVHLRGRAERHAQSEDEAISELQEERSRAQFVMDTCDEVLGALGDGRCGSG